MVSTIRFILAAVLLFGGASAVAEEKSPVVLFKTTKGDIKIELDSAKAPITTDNFLAYTKEGFFNGTIFHRVIPGFMVQGGGFDKDMKQKATKAPIKNESGNGLSNKRGTLSMARTSDPNSATAQFFINVADNANLDQGDGYAVFGRVIEGMDVVDAIVAVPTTKRGGHGDVPVDPVIIESATVVE
jgi:peptidyl-prolyl cis-trans isomerase A (cyclophilin A)